MRNIVLFMFILIMVSCEKEEDVVSILEAGNFVGVYTVIYNYNSSEADTVLGTTEFLLENGSYQITPNIYITPPHSIGYYTFTTSKITFQDTTYHTADFDWTLIINGEYQYSIDDDKLNMFQIDTESDRKYLYELIKE